MSRETKITLLILIIIVVLVGLLAWYLHHRAVLRERTAQTPEEQTAFQTQFTTLEGEAVAFTDITAETIVVLTWASWCPTCATLLPEFANMSKAYDEETVQFVALNRAEPLDVVTSYIDQMLPETVPEQVLILLDQQDTFFSSLEGRAVPELYIYDEYRQINNRFGGMIDLSQVQAVIESQTE